MTGVALTVGFDDALLTGHLARLAVADARGFNGVRLEIGDYLLGEVQDCLDGQKLFDGTAMWQSEAALGRSAKRKRAKKMTGRYKGVRGVGKTLIDYHHLYDSYTRQLTGTGVEVGSTSQYAAIHHFGGQTGSKAGRFQMLARPVLGMTPAHERRIGDLLIDQIRRSI